jgi:uncharacterized RDD family membrane protein YckC
LGFPFGQQSSKPATKASGFDRNATRNPQLYIVSAVNLHFTDDMHNTKMDRKSKLLENITTEPNTGKRVLAGLIDYLFIGSFYFAYLFAFGEPNNEGGYTVSGILTLPPVIFWGIITIGLEQWLGASLGNQIVGLRPISINGINRELTLVQSLKRHLLDPVDMFFFGLIGIIVIQKTERNQRIGDIWAETIVLKNKDKNIS